MGLELKAEEKSILELFTGDKNQYIIPPYQRPYSWDEEQCEELFNDLLKAFEDDKTDSYFLGNIVIASSREDKNRLEVIDGQQRLTTLTLLIKAFLFFDKDNKKLENSIWELDRRTGKKKEQRLKTMVFQERDAQFLKDALELEYEKKNTCKINKKDNQFKKNICYFYRRLDELEDGILFNFSDFLLDDISILPIQTQGDDKSIARENAIKIFETINDRGLPLSDSDLFKAKLFSNALSWKKTEDFIMRWQDLDEQCTLIDYSIDAIFKIYTQIIRGEQKIKTTEVGLRDFFNKKEYSPFNKSDIKYNKILNEIFKIIDCISFYQTILENPLEYEDVSKWFQILKEHRNKYPRTAMFVYLYKNGLDNNDKLIIFSENLIRLAYDKGAKSELQFKIYELIIKIIHDELEDYYPSKVKDSDFESFGILKNGYALLTFYLQNNQKVISSYKFDKIINSKDISNLDDSWNNINFKDYSETLGNILIIDTIKLRNTTLESKIKCFKNSNLEEIKELLPKLSNWTYPKYEERENNLRDRLSSFFRKPDEN
ncbi:MAG: DUF262 domain-containing protein [Sulfurovum sp.]|nr:DUF262 domain-containing protein [Sulfurovum sp.]